MEVQDNGSGIKAEDLAKLFQPSHTTKVSGHGLGMMIVQRILRDHGGHVAIESKEGVGTVVTLRFPHKQRRVRMLQAGEQRRVLRLVPVGRELVGGRDVQGAPLDLEGFDGLQPGTEGLVGKLEPRAVEQAGPDFPRRETHQ